VFKGLLHIVLASLKLSTGLGILFRGLPDNLSPAYTLLLRIWNKLLVTMKCDVAFIRTCRRKLITHINIPVIFQETAWPPKIQVVTAAANSITSHLWRAEPVVTLQSVAQHAPHEKNSTAIGDAFTGARPKWCREQFSGASATCSWRSTDAGSRRRRRRTPPGEWRRTARRASGAGGGRDCACARNWRRSSSTDTSATRRRP